MEAIPFKHGRYKDFKCTGRMAGTGVNGFKARVKDFGASHFPRATMEC